MFTIIDPTRVLLDKGRGIGITTMDDIEFTDYNRLRWNEFIEFTLLDEMKTKERRFSRANTKCVKTLLDLFCMDTGDTFVHYDNEQNPLIFELDDNYVILMAQYGVPIKKGGKQ